MAIHRTTNPSRAHGLTSIGALALCFFAQASGAGAAAQSPSPAPIATSPTGPIAITACDAIRLNNGYGMGNLTLNVGHANYFFKVSFVNDGTVAADSVRFQIDNNADRIAITDAGSYAPGNAVTHTLRSSAKTAQSVPRPGGTGPLACSVVAAHFVDGTSYAAPVASPAP